MDAAVNLARAGKQSTVVASTATWNVQTPDPSTELAPYTADRLREVTAAGFRGPRPKLLAPLRVTRVEKAEVCGSGVWRCYTWAIASVGVDKAGVGGVIVATRGGAAPAKNGIAPAILGYNVVTKGRQLCHLIAICLPSVCRAAGTTSLPSGRRPSRR